MTDLELAREGLRREALTYGNARNVNPYVTLLEEVKWRAGHVAWIRHQIAEAGEDALFTRDHNENLVDSPMMRRYDKERTLLDRACKLAIDAGIAERYVNLAELQGGIVMRVIDAALSDPTVALTEEQRAAIGPAFQRALALAEQEQAQLVS